MRLFNFFTGKTTDHHNEKIMTGQNIKDEILETVAQEVLFGFYNEEELFNEILDRMYDKEINTEWVKEIINQSYSERREETLNWKRPTHFDQLVTVFDQLNREDIIAIHRAGYTYDDGWEDVNEVWEEVQKENVSPVGYCFYHTQDLIRVVESDELVLSFGDICGEESKEIEVGNKIVAMLQQAGFETVWENTINRRIRIMNMCWQKFPDNESYGPDRAIKYLTQCCEY